MLQQRLALLILITGAIFFIGCNNTKKESSTSENLNEKENKEALLIDSLKNSLKGASFTDTVKNIKAFYFSNNLTKDTFTLTVSPGLIAKSISEIKITTSDGKVIYSDSFTTYYFVRDIFDPDTIPQNLNNKEYGEYILKYINSLTKSKFERHAYKEIASFFDNTVTDKAIMPTDMEMEEIEDKELYKEVLADTTLSIISFPCFNCDEGGSYYAYSRKKGKVISIFSTD